VAQILLVANKEAADVGGIASILSRGGHRVLVSPNLPRAGSTDFEIVIVDLSRNLRSDWRNLAEAVERVQGRSCISLVLAYSSIFRGAAMKIEVERIGARFLWI
jgi:hypothetical protein